MAAIRSLLRWSNWPLNWTEIIPDWTNVCIWEIEVDETCYIVQNCSLSGEGDMHLKASAKDRKMRGFDWSAWLNTAVISAWSFDLPAGLTRIATNIDETQTKTMIMWTGGTPGELYKITGWVEADDGRKDHGIFTVFVMP